MASLFQRRAQETRLAHALRSVPLWRDLPAADLVTLWRCLQEVRAPAGAVLCQRGEPGRRLGPGDCVGEMALLTGAPRSADVVVVDDAVLWALDRRDCCHKTHHRTVRIPRPSSSLHGVPWTVLHAPSGACRW